MTEQDLEFFREKTKLKGTFEQALTGLISRWKKVIDDCDPSQDKSSYRYAYRSHHIMSLEWLEENKESISSDAEIVTDYINRTKEFCFVHAFPISAGMNDAYGYIIAELEALNVIPR